jgi:hypothetical protein
VITKLLDLLALNWAVWGVWALFFASPELQAANFGTLHSQALIALIGGGSYFLYHIYS